MKKLEKVTFVDNLVSELQKAKSVVLVNYAGLGVKAQQDLKAKLKEVGGRMLVVKNTLLKRAGQSAKIDKQSLAGEAGKKLFSDTVLSGQTALIVADNDPIAPVQVLGKFAKESETPKFKVGIVDGMFQDSGSLFKLSTLPGRDVLLSQLLGSLMSNLYGLVGVLNAPMQKLIYVLNQKATVG